jgi:hypothetical protein
MKKKYRIITGINYFLSLFFITSKPFYHIILSIMMMTTINEHEMSKSLCGKCRNYVFEPEDKFRTWCTYFYDIYQAVREGKITLEEKSGLIDRSVRYDLYGLVYCEGFKPR